MQDKEWSNEIYLAGGFIRACIANEEVNDIDLFVKDKTRAEALAFKLQDNKGTVTTENAITIKGKLPIQVIHRWVFEKPEDVSNSFDFTICCAVVWFNNGKFLSFCDQNFYPDLAGKRLVYRQPVRNEDAGGSMLRVLKYYQRGYRIPVDSLGHVIARLVMAVDFSMLPSETPREKEYHLGRVLSGLLREVDPNVDPNHQSHLPSQGPSDTEDDSPF